MAEQFTNNATSTLAAGIATSATSLTVSSGDGAKFPSLSGSDFFRATLFKKSTGEIEIVKVTARSTDTFTITRAQEGTTALALSAGDLVELRPTAGYFNSLSVTDSTVQAGTYSYAADTGGVNTLAVTLNPVPASLTDGMVVRTKVNNTNTGAATLNVNSLGNVSIKKNGSDDLEAGDLVSGQDIVLIYDLSATIWHLVPTFQPTAAARSVMDDTTVAAMRTTLDVFSKNETNAEIQNAAQKTASAGANTTGSITGATQANPVVITSAAHGRNTGDLVYIDNIVGMTELNAREFTITVIDANTFSLNGEDGTGHSAWTSAGDWYVDDYKATFTPGIAAIADGQELVIKATTDSKTTVPTFYHGASSTGSITGATQANPVSITATAHGLATGDKVYIDSVAGMTELNGNRYVITVVDANTYTLDGIDGTSYTAYTSGGTWKQIGHPIVRHGGKACVKGDIQAGQYAVIKYDLSNLRWELLNPYNGLAPVIADNIITGGASGKIALDTITEDNINYANFKGLGQLIIANEYLGETSTSFVVQDSFRVNIPVGATSITAKAYTRSNDTGGGGSNVQFRIAIGSNKGSTYQNAITTVYTVGSSVLNIGSESGEVTLDLELRTGNAGDNGDLKNITLTFN